MDDRIRLVVKDKAFKADYKFLEEARPGKDVFGSTTADEQRWVVVASSDTDPGEAYVFDRKIEEADAAVQGPRAAAARRRSPR